MREQKKRVRLRGLCPVCKYSAELRVDGGVGRHILYSGMSPYLFPKDPFIQQKIKEGRVYLADGGYICEGTGKKPLVNAVV